MNSPFPSPLGQPVMTNREHADCADLALFATDGMVTLATISRLLTDLLHLAYARNLGDTDRLLTEAQMRFIDELDAEDDA